MNYNNCKECETDDTIQTVTPIFSETLLINNYCTTCEIETSYKVEFSENNPNGLIVKTY